jgi:GNAT superfamily N-acetyltransferase
MGRLIFRPFQARDYERCLAIFDANCPAYFAPNERADYAAFLDGPAEGYEVCELHGEIVGAFGLSRQCRDARELTWILLDTGAQGRGTGSAIMQHVLATCRDSGTSTLLIAASHRSAPFFERFGATVIKTTEDGWGPDMHRVDMRLYIPAQGQDMP